MRPIVTTTQGIQEGFFDKDIPELAVYNNDPFFASLDGFSGASGPQYFDLNNGDHLGSGGFGEVYKVKGPKDEFFALKIFYGEHPEPEASVRQRINWPGQMQRVMRRVHVNGHVVSQLGSSVRPILVPYDVGKNWFVMTYAPGVSAEELAKGDFPFRSSPTVTGSILRTHARTLKGLHDRGYLFIDNNLGAVVFDSETNQSRTVDIDLITTLDQANTRGDLSRKFCNPHYASNEQLLTAFGNEEGEREITTQSDLRGFALMIDRMFNGNFLLNFGNDPHTLDPQLLHTELAVAREGERRYPRKRVKKLPRPFRKVVPDLIKHKKKQNPLTIDDMLEAVEKAFPEAA